jgi:hypothetical protein
LPAQSPAVEIDVEHRHLGAESASARIGGADVELPPLPGRIDLNLHDDPMRGSAERRASNSASA